MSNETFYTIAAAMLRESKVCKYPPTRHCIPIKSDAECQKCVAEKLKAVREAK